MEIAIDFAWILLTHWRGRTNFACLLKLDFDYRTESVLLFLKCTTKTEQVETDRLRLRQLARMCQVLPSKCSDPFANPSTLINKSLYTSSCPLSLSLSLIFLSYQRSTSLSLSSQVQGSVPHSSITKERETKTCLLVSRMLLGGREAERTYERCPEWWRFSILLLVSLLLLRE